MIKWIKNILTVFSFVMLYSFAQAQGGVAYFSSSSYNQWIEFSEKRCGKAGFYIYIRRYYKPSHRVFYYDIYIWSDSYYRNCLPSYTYINNIMVYMHDGKNYKPVLNLDYYIASPKKSDFNGWNYLGYLYSRNSNQNIKITWTDKSPY